MAKVSQLQRAIDAMQRRMDFDAQAFRASQDSMRQAIEIMKASGDAKPVRQRKAKASILHDALREGLDTLHKAKKTSEAPNV